MRSYGTVSPTFWTRGTGKRLRGHAEAQIVALYLMTSPHTSMVGIFALALPTICHETGLTYEEATKGLHKCAEEQFAFWDEEAELVFVPALAHHQLGESLKKTDHRVKGVLRALAPFKGHRFHDLFLERYADLYSLEAPSKPRPRGDDPDPDHVPDPVGGERERGSAPPPEPSGPRAADDAVTVAEVFEAWRRETGRSEARPDEKRLGIIADRLREGRTPDELVAAIRNRRNDPWLMGKNDRNRVYDDLETLLKNASQVERLMRLTRPERLKGAPARATRPAAEPEPMATGDYLAAVQRAKAAVP